MTLWDRLRGWWYRDDASAEYHSLDEHFPPEDPLLEEWLAEPLGHGVTDTGRIVATPEDLAEIGPFDPVTRIPRQGRGRHRKGAS